MTEELNRRAQPAAPAHGSAIDLATHALQWHVDNPNNSFTDEPRKRDCRAIRALRADAAPSVAPEPLFLLHSGQIDSGGEQDDWETEADSQVRVDEFCRLHPGKTIPLFAHPPRAPLTADEAAAISDLLKAEHDGSDFEPECPLCTAYRKLSAHGISAEGAEGADGGRGKA